MRLIAASLCLCLSAGMAASAELSSEDARELEELLVRLGFNPGPVDGVADARTEAAIEDYQSFAALRVDGVASPALLEELRGVAKSLGVSVERSPAEAAPPSSVEVAATNDESRTTSQSGESAAPPPPGLVTGAPWDTAVHLASFKQEAKAHAEWQRLQRRLPDLLDGMDSRISAFDLGDEGLFFRLYAGPFPNLATAQDFCVTVSLKGFRCGVARGDTMKVAATSPVAPEGPNGPEEQEAEAAEAEAAAEAAAAAVVEEQPSEPPAEAGETIATSDASVESDVPEPSPTLEETPAAEPPDMTESAATEEEATVAQIPEVDIEPIPPAQALAEPTEEAEPSAVMAAPTVPVTAAQIDAATPDTGPEAAPEEVAEDVNEDVTADVTEDSTLEVTEETASETAVGTPTLLFAATQFAEATPEPISEDAAETGLSKTAIGAPTHLVTAFNFADEAEAASGEPASEPTGSVEEQSETAETAIVEAADPGGAEGDTAETTEIAETAGTLPADETEPEAAQTAAAVASGAEDYATATAAFEVGDCATALRFYEQAFEKGGLPRRALASGHNNRGRCFYDRGGYEDALADFDRAIGLDRDFAAAYYNRGRAHNAMGNSAEARADLKVSYDLGFGRLEARE